MAPQSHFSDVEVPVKPVAILTDHVRSLTNEPSDVRYRHIDYRY